MTVKTGRLFVVATPIGNLEDITLRALKTLREVDLIVCEDTKQSRKLLSHYGISKQLISYYKPKERDKANKIIDILLSGKDVALISDAGTPAISDPGQILIDEARKNGIEILAIPGPSSLITALSVSGFKIIPFMFDGFIPKKRSDLIKRLEELKGIASTLV
ncbi:MAG: 16S rRNA (cytidine(1402)-2'-O)-methyltransferase, partial [Proteobacteria bacterium]|nr:16S rRNA (cytidine(1402)-2'-O)-methyltransferase [Pseudomonadota bacterium]